MNRTQIGDIKDLEGKEVELAGWVHARRDHGKIIFIDLRDHTGLVQVVFAPSSPPPTSPSKEGEGASGLRLEYVVKVRGKVKKRPPAMVNDKIPNGNYEVEATALTIVNRAEALPIPVDDDGYETNEEMRMKYRYLDLRRERLQRNLRLRHKVTMLAREFLSSQGFIEVETPLLTKSSPEGARDFLVPSRLQPGKFYALPQAPQQYKQLLMIAGVDRYFQIARALRDEDLRGERQLEHTQIDMEMSWAGEEGVRAITEAMMIRIAEACGKKIWKKPFPVFTHEEAMKKFGADKFDLRDSDASVGASSNASVGASSSASVGAGPADPDTLAFAWVVDFPLLERDEDPSTGSGQGRWTFAHNPFSAPKAEHVERLMSAEDEQDENLGNIRAQQYDLVCNGHELASGGVRISDPMVQRKVFEIMGLTPEQVESRFGHLIRAYEYGAPPHAGIAPGLDRLVMLLANERNIREVIAFPVSSSGQTSVMDAPSAVDEKQLRELGIRIAPPDAHA